MAIQERKMDKIKQGVYYIIIAIISILALVFLPMVGSTIGLEWNFPTTTAGWIVWAGTRAIITTINVLMFHCFILQGKTNVKNNKKYLDAIEKLGKTKNKEYHPMSPKKWSAMTYGKKGTMLVLSSALTLIALSQAVLSYDWMSLLTYLFTIIMGVIFGILQMKKTEEYYTTEFVDWANLEFERANVQDIKKEANIAQMGAIEPQTSENKQGE